MNVKQVFFVLFFNFYNTKIISKNNLKLLLSNELIFLYCDFIRQEKSVCIPEQKKELNPYLILMSPLPFTLSAQHP